MRIYTLSKQKSYWLLCFPSNFITVERKFDLEQRLIRFSVNAIRFAERMPISYAGKHLSSQLIRRITVPALHYREAQSAESRNDFIHKLKIAL